MQQMSIDLMELQRAFEKELQRVTNADCTVIGHDAALKTFEVWTQHNDDFREIVQHFIAYRGESLYSDWEVVAFMFAIRPQVTMLPKPRLYEDIASVVRKQYKVELLGFRIYDTPETLYQAEKSNLSPYAEEDILDEDNVFYACGKFIFARGWYEVGWDNI